IHARAQHQMKRVAENDLRSEADELFRQHRLDGAVGADRHECGCLDHPALERNASAPRATVGGEEIELHQMGLGLGAWARRSLSRSLNDLKGSSLQPRQLGPTLVRYAPSDPGPTPRAPSPSTNIASP